MTQHQMIYGSPFILNFANETTVLGGAKTHFCASGRVSALGQKWKWRRFQVMPALPLKDGVIGRPSLWIAEEFWVLRFRLMVKRGPWLGPQASEGEAQHGPFCWIRRIGQGDQHLHCG